MMAKKLWTSSMCAIVAFAFCVPLRQAAAARLAQVELKVVDVRQGPAAGSTVLFTVKRGSWVYSSNLPTEGYYKIRTRDGQIGWVPTDAVRQYSGKGAPTGAPPQTQDEELPPSDSPSEDF